MGYAADNGSLDLNKVRGYEFKPMQGQYDEKDGSLYALSIGAATDAVDVAELKFVYELSAKFQTIPFFGVTFVSDVLMQLLDVPGLEFNPMLLLHGEHYLELKRPLPPKATLHHHAQIVDVFDKGKGALLVLDVHTADQDGRDLALNRLSVFIRGLTGFGGGRGPANAYALPDRAPDHVIAEKTAVNQALHYRLASGDRNPLHADPAMAAFGGFDRPILHGLCTYGFAGRAVLQQYGGNDGQNLKSINGRFSKHVFPGETIVTEMWQESPTRVLFQSKVAERDVVVLSNATVELYK
jgi:3-hydroxyacyl-CoA dehydrogenase/3a,7a,12a-trihydroxy-5b-cholest-24-enoyl-CoA hydratase